MGQKIGKAILVDIAQPFSNLPKRAILNMWQVFNNIGDGFGVRADELEEICIDLKDELNISQTSMLEKIRTLFVTFDTDNNGLIDALEFFSAISVLSGMKKRAIMEFVLTIYDFDGTECLSMDEVVLALKSVSAGLCKLQEPQSTTRERIVIAKEEQIEQLVSEIFCSQSDSGEVDDSVRLSIKILCQLLISHPDVCYWFAYFSTPPQTGLPTYELTFRDKDFTTENPIQVRSAVEDLAVNWDVRCEEAIGSAQSTGSAGTAGTARTGGTAGSQAKVSAPGSTTLPPAAGAVAAVDGAEPKKDEQWRSAVALLTPVEFAGAQLPKASPNCSIAPEWVYGYQSERCKGNLHYTSNGDIVYNISKYAVVYSIKLHQQRIFSGHNEEILSLKLHPSKQIVATGEIGATPKLLVWHAETHKILYSAAGFHQNGITQLCFSQDGRLLISVGNDSQQSISVCLWEEGSVVFNSPVSAAPSLCLACTILRDNTIVAAGDSYVHFWSYYNEGYVRRAGNFSRFTALQPITAVAPVCESDNLVTGTASGLLLLWVDVNCVRSVKGHNGTINTIFSCAHGILSGGMDQRIRMWSTTLEPSFTFDVSHYGINPIIRSLCMSTDGTSILLGTRGANIFEISAIDGSDLRGGPIAIGHSYAELLSVATHPSKFEFVTVGQDQTLRVFDMSTRTQLKIATFDGEASTVAYNPMGDILVVGFAGAHGAAKTGAFVVLNEEDLSMVHEAKDSSSSITVVAFSPEGETLAVGCSDGGIYLYAVHDDYELVGKCDRHVTAVTEIDFSRDGEWLRSNSVAKELFFFNTDDASFQSNISSMRDVQWSTHNCSYSWHMKELHHAPYVADELLRNHLLPISEEMVGTVEPYVAGATSQGYIRLYPFPCVTEGTECHRYPAHCAQIAGIRFAFDGNRLITVGQKDRCILQWRCLPYPADTETQPAEDNADHDLKLEALTGPLLLDGFMPAEAGLPVGLLNAPWAQDKASKHHVDADEVPPGPENDNWLISVVEPTALPTVRTAIPELSLLLEHVYGYESQSMRNNVRYVSGDEIVYTVATMGVVLNTGSKAQRIFKFHSDAITSFACSKDGALVATGQMGHRPTVAVWDTRTCTTRFVVPEVQLNAVSCVAFSADKELLAVVNLDRDHTITVYDWKANVAVSKFYGGSNHILGVFFTAPETSREEGVAPGPGLVSYGVKELKIWKGVATRFPTSVRPKIGEQGSLQTFLCGELFLGRPVIGTSDGFLYQFGDTALIKTVKGHSGPLTAMDVNASKKWLVSGGKDGTVRVWSADLACIKEFVVDSLLETVNPSVRSVAFNALGTHIVIGTRAAEIFEVAVTNGAKVGDKSLVEGHGIRQLWGLASHPIKEECITTGDDATLRIWDCRNYVQKRALKMDTASRAVAYSADGKLIAVGFGSGKRVKGKLAPKEGAFSILRAADMKVMHEGKDSNSAIRVVKFSPDGKTFVVASDDNNMYTYNVKDEYSRRSTIKSHQAPVLFVDFSSESNYIVSVDSSRTVCFTEVNSGVTIPTPEALRDEKWVTATSPYSWAVKGFWASQAPGVVPLTVQKSWGGLLVAAGNNAGGVTVAHNPYPRKAGFLHSCGHAGRISSLAWVAGDGALLSIGTKDHALLQWKCLYDNTRESGNEGGRSCEESEMEIDGGHELTQTALRVSGVAANAVPLDGAGSIEQKTPEESLANWYSMICAPSTIHDDDQAVPDAKFELEFSHGARLADCRRLLRYNEDGRAIYVVSTMAVIYDRNSVSQLYYSGHKDAIISLEVDASGKVAATGELSALPDLHVWDAKTGRAMKVFERLHRQGITCVSFSASGEYLISLGQDVHNSIAVCHSPSKRWHDGHHICSTSVSSSKMLWCLHSSSSTSFPIVVGGAAGNVYFFRVVRGAAERVKGVYGKRHKIQPMLCGIDGVVTGSLINAPAPVDLSEEPLVTNATSMLATPGSMKATAAASLASPTIATVTSMNVMLCGTVTGYIYIFSDCKVVNKVPAHEAPVNALSTCGKRFLTAGKDGKVKLWSSELKQLFVFNINSYLPRPFLLSCHALCGNKASTSFVVGMRGGEIFEVSLQSHAYCMLAEGHSRGELHALEVNPTNPDEYATAGDDGVVMVWSVSKRYCLRKVRVEAASRALAYSPDGAVIAVGFGAGDGHPLASKDGALMILDAASLEIVREERRAKHTITDIKYGPLSSELMAVASTDGRVFLHGTKKYDLLKVVEMPTRNCAVTRIDFSKDASTLRVCTSLDQLLFCNVENGDFISNPTAVRDVKWLQTTCPFAWFAQGVYRKGMDGVDVSAVSVHPNNKLIAASYRNGEVRVYRYPCQSQQGSFLTLAGVASDATRLRFTADGRHLIILDSKTRSVLQYRVTV